MKLFFYCSYSVNFDGNGANSGSMSSLRCIGGTVYTLSANEFQRDGWLFTGWNLRKDGTGGKYTDGARFMDLTSSHGSTVNLYAQWEKQQETCSLEAAEIQFTEEMPVYTGSAQRPAVTVYMDGMILRETQDYTLSYADNVNAGTAILTVTGAGSYYGSIQKEFTIRKASQSITADSVVPFLHPGETVDLNAQAAGELRYQSEKPNIVSVDRNGKVTAVSAGSAEINVLAEETGNYESASRSFSFTVEETPPTPT